MDGGSTRRTWRQGEEQSQGQSRTRQRRARRPAAQETPDGLSASPRKRGRESRALSRFRLGELGAPVLALGDERQRGQREQHEAGGEQGDRDRPLEEDQPVAVRDRKSTR